MEVHRFDGTPYIPSPRNVSGEKDGPERILYLVILFYHLALYMMVIYFAPFFLSEIFLGLKLVVFYLAAKTIEDADRAAGTGNGDAGTVFETLGIITAPIFLLGPFVNFLIFH